MSGKGLGCVVALDADLAGSLYVVLRLPSLCPAFRVRRCVTSPVIPTPIRLLAELWNQ